MRGKTLLRAVNSLVRDVILRRKQPQDHLDGALDGSLPLGDDGQDEPDQDRTEEHVDDVVQV
jgi:hypothetical protein